jgi:hypothetical protein
VEALKEDKTQNEVKNVTENRAVGNISGYSLFLWENGVILFSSVQKLH